MTYVTSDLHGYPLDAFLRHLGSVRFSSTDELYILGDVIDRNGDGGIAMLQWCRKQPNVHLLRGNHEDLLLSCRFLFSDIADENIEKLTTNQLLCLTNWEMNGATPTINSLKKLYHEDRGDFLDLWDYIEDAPLYDILRLDRRRPYILVHSGIGNYSHDKDLPDYSEDDLLWFRPTMNTSFYPEAKVILGHTPTSYIDPVYKGRMINTPTWIDIDTGAAGGGHPMLLRLDDEQPFYINPYN